MVMHNVVSITYQQRKKRMELKRIMWMALTVILVIVSEWKCSNGCLEHERIALLQLQSEFSSQLDGISSSDFFRSWGHNSDCCGWSHVVCDNFTKNVIELDLSYPLFFQQSLLDELYLNITMFLPFRKLQTLSLAYSGIAGFVEVEGFEKLSQLESLDMSSNSINDSKFLSSLNSLPFLKDLSLSWNDLQGTVYLEDFVSLKSLDLSYNDIKAIKSNRGVSKKLEFLHLSGNKLNNSILSFLKALPSLKVLHLAMNELQDTLLNLEEFAIADNSNNEFLRPKGLCDSRYLQVLDLRDNNIEGTLPACLANLTSLQSLDLSGNHFTGDVAQSPIISLTSLQNLSLSNNNFKIPISLGPLYNHSKLKIFEGLNNLIYDDFVPKPNLFPKFQLNSITLSGQGQGDVRAIPKFLWHQHDLREVEINDVHFKGEFPTFLLDNNTELELLCLRNNSLSRLSDFSNRSYTNLKTLDISNNLFDGEIPLDFGISFQNLKNLNMSSSQFSGYIPSSFGDMSLLEVMDLSSNNLEGEIFSSDSNLTELQYLYLDGNSFTGIPDSLSYSIFLQVLDISNNFIGGIPDSLSSSVNLGALDISNNSLSGPLPGWMGNLSNLYDLRMSKNNLRGPIPLMFCQLKRLYTFDLSENNISGSIPSCFSPPDIRTVRLSKNKLQGTLKHAFINSSSMVLLDLSNNRLSGGIPDWIHRLSQLNYLLLNNNYLSGEIPIQLCELDKLSLINLSNNNLYGTIPGCLRIAPLEEQIGVYEASAPGSSTTIGSVAFPTKTMSYDYQGEILFLMSGIDFSRNNFCGKIPPRLGYLRSIQALNLSHNNLTGPIPETFGYLKQVESLDLSDNLLFGEIPPQLGGLSSLAFFTVANNNLSGEIPTTTQFTTFNESSFYGNPLLCGRPLPKSCNDLKPELPKVVVDHGEDDGFMDMECFYASFAATYLTLLLGFIIVLLINPYWRRRWFYHIEKWMTSSYNFVVDNLPIKF